MSRVHFRRKWKDSYACRRQFFLFLFFCLGITGLFKLLKIVHEEDHRKEFHNVVSKHLNFVLTFVNRNEDEND